MSNRSKHITLISFFLLAVAVRLFLATHFIGFKYDQMFFIHWMDQMDRYGITKAYELDQQMNYPPLFLLFLLLYKQILNVFGVIPDVGTLAIKFPMIILDSIALLFLFSGVRKRVDFKKIVPILVFIALNPAILFNGSVWGQIDIMHSGLIVGSLLLLDRKPTWSGVLYALALLTKFQAIMFLPVFGGYFLWSWIKVKKFESTWRYILGFLIPVSIILLYFGVTNGIHQMFKNGYLSSVGAYPQLSANALNPWYYLFGYAPDTPDTKIIVSFITIRVLGYMLFLITALITVWYLFRSDYLDSARLLRAGVFVSLSSFMLLTQMHERYIFPALISCLVLIIFDRSWIRFSLGLTLTTFFNMYVVVYPYINPNNGMWIVYINCIIFYLMFKEIINISQDKPTETVVEKRSHNKKGALNS
ncbi:hypothetical protein [Gorillibacterium sp. sgz500922]|uniref:hypothetical protein n=1 Tax=Gorillibacterium sp. sgz500922 TaxID=3446694 RepID=UPI003F66A5D3